MLKIVFAFLIASAHLCGYCAFCDGAVLERQTFYEDDLVLALYTHKPILPGHCLVISKRHVERFELLTDEETLRIGQVIKMVHQAVSENFGTSSYLLLQKNGLEVGQTVPHVHFHYVPRQAGDSSSLLFVLKMYLANLKAPISSEEMQQQIERLYKAIKAQ
jgi:diadenosine tetraphosphate (Ap4A) HIT family hydrolase